MNRSDKQFPHRALIPLMLLCALCLNGCNLSDSPGLQHGGITIPGTSSPMPPVTLPGNASGETALPTQPDLPTDPTAPTFTTEPTFPTEQTNPTEVTEPTVTVAPTQPSAPATQECSHDYSAWSTTKSATCDTNGVKTRKCSKCGNAETQTIAATGHAWDEGKVTTTPTSCSDMGVKTYTCTACGRTKTEQIKGNHTFGSWQWEEYTYTQDGVSRVSHRKVRTCTKCGYKETDGTPNHYCARGSDNHVVTTVKAGDCSTRATMRSTCQVCGWYVEYEGSKGKCNWVDKEVHLSDYGPYTNELDATVSECTGCGDRSVVYHKGEGWSDYNRYSLNLSISQGNAYGATAPLTDDFDYVDHPEWQTVKRDFVYDSDGYVKQFTLYWWYNGSRYSQVINCEKQALLDWFAEYGLTGSESASYKLKVYGAYVAPHGISGVG